MTTDRAIDILAMSEQARWRDGIEPEDVKKAVETIRKALEQEPCDDVISRRKAIHVISACDGKSAQIEALEQLPPVNPQEPKWIPMIRREPTDEEKAEYLAQNGEELCYMLENEMPLNGQEVLVSIGEYVSEDVFDEDFYNFENSDIENVDAWMPKPEPYKAESEGASE